MLVPPKAQSRRGRANKENKPQPISGLDVDALLRTDSRRQTRIDPQNAIPEFKQAVLGAEDVKGMGEAVRQMGAIIRGIVSDSLGDSGYERALEHLGAVRSQMVAMEEPGLYNAFARDFARRLLRGELGGDRRELWWMMKGVKLGLIDSDTSESSDVTPEEAAKVSEPPRSCCTRDYSQARLHLHDIPTNNHDSSSYRSHSAALKFTNVSSLCSHRLHLSHPKSVDVFGPKCLPDGAEEYVMPATMYR